MFMLKDEISIVYKNDLNLKYKQSLLKSSFLQYWAYDSVHKLKHMFICINTESQILLTDLSLVNLLWITILAQWPSYGYLSV